MNIRGQSAGFGHGNVLSFGINLAHQLLLLDGSGDTCDRQEFSSENRHRSLATLPAQVRPFG